MKRILIANCILLASTVAQASPQVDCLAKMAYMEARGINKQAVKDVTDVMCNRIKHHKLPDSVCKNIKIKLEKGNYIRHTIGCILIISLATRLNTCSYEPYYNKTQYEKGQNK